ncbi:MAG: CARDB domain-containing protein [bacterium]|nr:CARDB domain-containing protein [bacterium]
MKKIAGIALVMFIALSPSADLAEAKSDSLGTSDTINSFLSAIVNWPSIFSFYHVEEDEGGSQQEPQTEQQEQEEFPEEQVEEVPEIFQFTRNLYAGMKTNDEINDEIYRLQEFLLDQGFYPPDRGTSGVFGSITTSAIKKFQSKYKLSQSGQLDASTRSVINKIFKDLASGYFDFDEPIEEEEVIQEDEEKSRKSKLGDINDDGEINSGDAIILREFLEGSGDLDNLQLFRSDVNQDGRVNSKDWKIILDYDVGIVSSIPVSPNYNPSSQAIKETPEESDSGSGETTALPDLTVLNVKIDPENPQGGKFFTVSYTVKNIGNASLSSRYFEPNIYIIPVKGTIDSSEYIISAPSTCFHPASISPGYDCDMTNSVSVNKAGSYTIQVVADSGAALKESNKNNNAGKTSFEIAESVISRQEDIPDNKPKVSVLFPNGTDRDFFKTGSEVDLKWSSENLPEGGRLAAELYKDGSFAQTISTRLTNDGEFKWQVPDTLLFNFGPYYKVRIFYYDSKGKLAAEDYSDGMFAIIDYKTARPTLKFTADRNTISKGETVKLSWVTTNAEDGCVVYFDKDIDTKGPNGTEIVRLENNKTFQIACRGAGGVADAELTVKVGGAVAAPSAQPQSQPASGTVTLNIKADPSVVYKGNSSTISWESTDKTSVCGVASGANFVSDTDKKYKDYFTAQPDKTTEYIVICSGQGGTIVKSSLTVTVTIAPPAKLIITAPPEISSGTIGTPVEGQGLFFKGTVLNQGGIASKPTKAGFLIDFAPLNDSDRGIDIPALEPGQSRPVVSSRWEAKTGEYTLGLCFQEGPEVNKNDCKTYTFRVVSVANAGPAGYTFCSGEGDYCKFTGTKKVAYGVGGKFKYLTIGGGTPCEESVFGDPISGVRKACYYQGEAEAATPAPTSGPVGPAGYTFCAKQNNQCNFTGTKRVAYGTNGKFKYLTLANGADCSGRTFLPDPAPGETKSCYIKEAIQAKLVVVAPPEISSGVANEGQELTFKGKLLNEGEETSEPASVGFFIDNTLFSDKGINIPALEPGKSQSVISTSWKAEAGEHTLTMCVQEKDGKQDCKNYKFKVGEGPIGYTFCAKEGDNCKFTGTKNVAYGANGKFKYLTIGNGTACESSVFGDPILGVAKACYIKNAETNLITPQDAQKLIGEVINNPAEITKLKKRTGLALTNLVETATDSRTDFNADGKIDFNDFFPFADAFGTAKNQPLTKNGQTFFFELKFDLANTGASKDKIDLDDFFIFADNFGKSADQKSVNISPCQELFAGQNAKDPGKINIIFVGVNSDAKNVIDWAGVMSSSDVGLFSFEPFASNKTKFNLWYISEVAKVSGLDPNSPTSIIANTLHSPVDDFAARCQAVNDYNIGLVNLSFPSAALTPHNTAFISLVGLPTLDRRGDAGGQFVHEFSHLLGLKDEYLKRGNNGAYYTGGPESYGPNCGTVSAVSACSAWCKGPPKPVEEFKSIDCSAGSERECKDKNPVCAWSSSKCVNAVKTCVGADVSSCVQAKICQYRNDTDPYFKSSCYPVVPGLNIGTKCAEGTGCFQGCFYVDLYKSSKGSLMTHDLVNTSLNMASQKALCSRIKEVAGSVSGKCNQFFSYMGGDAQKTSFTASFMVGLKGFFQNIFSR